jgi:hypothetical protein
MLHLACDVACHLIEGTGSGTILFIKVNLCSYVIFTWRKNHLGTKTRDKIFFFRDCVTLGPSGCWPCGDVTLGPSGCWLIPTTFTPPKCGFTPPNGYNFYSSVRTCATIHIHFRVFSGHYSVIGVFSGPFSVIGTTGAFYCQVESRHGTPESRLGLYVLFTSKCFPAKKEKTRTQDGLRLPRRDGDHGIGGCWSPASRPGFMWLMIMTWPHNMRKTRLAC